ncbi:hypothetical protein LINGRAHAP2_LOCUS17695 [Linum grandiflorum]
MHISNVTWILRGTVNSIGFTCVPIL